MQAIEMKRLTPLALAAILILAVLTATFVMFNRASAASLTQVMVRMDRMKVSQATTGTVCAKPATTGTEGKVVVTFPSGYTVSTTAGNWAVSTTNLAWPAGAAAWTVSAPSIAGQAVTFTSPDLTVGTLYCFNWTNTAALSNPAAASGNLVGTVATQTSGGSGIDSGSYTTAAVSDDQIAVSASVPQSFTFSLSGNTDSLGSLSTGSVSSSPTPRFATISTNAKNGWTVWANDATTGLASASAPYTIASTTPGTNSTLSSGTEGYNTGVTANGGTGSGTVTVATPFVGGATGKGGGLNTNLQSLASSTGANNGATVTLTNNAAISATTPSATDYADTITVVGAGLF